MLHWRQGGRAFGNAAMVVQLAELARLPRLFGRLSQRDNELESLTDNAAGIELQRWNRLLQTIEEDYRLLDQFNEVMERLFRSGIDPSGLTDLQLEQHIDVFAEADELVRGSFVDTLEDLVTSSRKLLLMAKGLSLPASFSETGVARGFKHHAQQSLETRERTLELARRWRDELVTPEISGRTFPASATDEGRENPDDKRFRHLYAGCAGPLGQQGRLVRLRCQLEFSWTATSCCAPYSQE